MNKKIIAILTAMALTIGACACSKEEETKKSKKDKDKEKVEDTTEEEEDETTTTEEETTTTEEETTTTEEETTTTADESSDDTDFEFTMPEVQYSEMKNPGVEDFCKELEAAGYWVLGVNADDPDAESDLPSGSYGFYGVSLMTGDMVVYIETTEEGMAQYKDNPDMFAGSEVEITLTEDGDFTYITGGDDESGYLWGFFDYANNCIYMVATAEDGVEKTAKEMAAKLGYNF